MGQFWRGEMKELHLTALLLCLSSNLLAYSGGNGLIATPYQIANIADYWQLSETPTDWHKSFILTANLDFSEFIEWEIEIAPVGNGVTPFTGIFNGNGHTISNPNFTSTTLINNVGLFGYVGSGGQICGLGINNAHAATSYTYVGCLAGRNQGTISSCYATGSVAGYGGVGGLVGYNQGTLTSCHANCFVDGLQSIGGLAGHNQGTLNDCYATGVVSATDQTEVGTQLQYIGGLVGYNESGMLTGCYASGSVSVTGNLFIYGGANYIGGLVGENWGGSLNDCHANGSVSATGIDASVYAVGGLTGGQDNWGTISNCYSTGQIIGQDEVGGIVGRNSAGALTACFANGPIDGQDDVAGLAGYNAGRIVDCHSTGTVYGSNNVGGLVGCNSSSYEISNCYSTSTVSGSSNVGGLVGYSAGGIYKCYSTGTVIGYFSHVGGLVGGNLWSYIISCYSTGAVSGDSHVGGLVGYNYGNSSYTFSCYSTGRVNGYSKVGGLVGYNGSSGDVINCYSTGTVSGHYEVGGLVGRNDSSSVISSFWDKDTSDRTTSEGGTGKTTAEMMTLSMFVSPPASWDFINETTNGTDDYWMMLREHEDYPRLAWQPMIAGDIAGLYGVNSVDYAEIAAHWGQSGCPAGCSNADINDDGTVNIMDLMSLAENWMIGM